MDTKLINFDLPVELKNKIFFYATEHPCAKIMKDARETHRMFFNDNTWEMILRSGVWSFFFINRITEMDYKYIDHYLLD